MNHRAHGKEASTLINTGVQAVRSIQFFIVGTGRCGTTLVRDSLRLHPNVYVPAESHWIPIQHETCNTLPHPCSIYTDIVERVFHVDGQLTVDVMAAEIGLSKAAIFDSVMGRLGQKEVTVVEFNNALYDVFGEAMDAGVVGDKTPDYCAYISLLHELWPAAKFIHVIRDGRDVALSMSGHPGFQKMVACNTPNWIPLALDKRYELPQSSHSSHSLEDYIWLWRFRIEQILESSNRLPSNSYFTLHYEDLVHRPRAHMARIADFLEIDNDELWTAKVEQLTYHHRVNTIKDRQIWCALTSVAHDTLAALGYKT